MTVPGRGYRFAAKGKRAPLGDDQPDRPLRGQAGSLPVIGYSAPPFMAAEHQPGKTQAILGRRRSYVRLVIACLPALALAGAVAMYFTLFGSREQPIRSVAVLPFANGSTDKQMEYLVDGLSENRFGPPQTMRLGQLMHHAANHAVQHRGQVALLLRVLGYAPGNFDILLYYPFNSY